MRERMENGVHDFQSAVTRPAPDEQGSHTPPYGASETLGFQMKPKDVKSYLDRFVIGQDEVKKTLAIAICDHYKQVQRPEDGTEQSGDYTKPNILLIGPTGVGKTYIIRKLAQLVGVPFVKADATKFSETGYVGAKVEDLLRDLLQQAQGDLQRAESGIIYLDEADKLAARGPSQSKEVNTRGVQFGLLRLMEESDVDLRVSQDMYAQLQAVLDFQRGKIKRPKINTKHILFILSGAFNGLEEIIRQRLGSRAIGFEADSDSKELPTPKQDSSILNLARVEDFISYGFEPEFMGRLPVRVACHALDATHYLRILKESEGSFLRQLQLSFADYGITVHFAEDALEFLAEAAAEEQTGARALLSLCEKALRPFKFELPSSAIRSFTVDAALLKNPEASLQALLHGQALH